MLNNSTLFWLETTESIARKQYDGHYTLIMLPDGYRFCFGILNHRYDIDTMAAGATLIDAIMLGIINESKAVTRTHEGKEITTDRD